jgi:hypothetical protein
VELVGLTEFAGSVELTGFTGLTGLSLAIFSVWNGAAHNISSTAAMAAQMPPTAKYHFFMLLSDFPSSAAPAINMLLLNLNNLPFIKISESINSLE